MVWARTFYVCYTAHHGSTGGFLWVQDSSGVVWQPRNLHVSHHVVLLSPHLCFFTGFFDDLFVARNDSRMSKKTSTWTEQIYGFTTMEAEGESKDPVKRLPPPLPHPLANAYRVVSVCDYH